MPDEQASFHPSIPVVLTSESTTETSIVPVQQTLSPEDKMIFYAVLQDIANELRRMSREQKKHQAQREHLH